MLQLLISSIIRISEYIQVYTNIFIKTFIFHITIFYTKEDKVENKKAFTNKFFYSPPIKHRKIAIK